MYINIASSEHAKIKKEEERRRKKKNKKEERKKEEEEEEKRDTFSYTFLYIAAFSNVV